VNGAFLFSTVIVFTVYGLTHFFEKSAISVNLPVNLPEVEDTSVSHCVEEFRSSARSDGNFDLPQNDLSKMVRYQKCTEPDIL